VKYWLKRAAERDSWGVEHPSLSNRFQWLFISYLSTSTACIWYNKCILIYYIYNIHIMNIEYYRTIGLVDGLYAGKKHAHASLWENQDVSGSQGSTDAFSFCRYFVSEASSTSWVLVPKAPAVDSRISRWALVERHTKMTETWWDLVWNSVIRWRHWDKVSKVWVEQLAGPGPGTQHALLHCGFQEAACWFWWCQLQCTNQISTFMI